MTDQPASAPTQGRLRFDVLLTFGGRAATGAGAFAAAIVAARELGPSGRGIMAVALTLSATLMQIGHLGLVSANPYFVARRPDAVPRIISNSLVWGSILGGALVVVVVLANVAVTDLLPGLDWPVILAAVLALPAALTVLLLQGVLLGEGRVLAHGLPQAALSIATVAGLAVAAAFANLTVTAVVVVMVAQWLLAAPVYYVLAIRQRSRLVNPDIALARGMIRYALRIYAATVLSFLVIKFDLFLVNSYLGPQQAGLYSVAVVLADAVLLLPIAVSMNIFFRVARGEDHITAVVFRSMIVLYGAVCLATAALAYWVIPVLFGEAFTESIRLFYCLLPGVFSLGMLTILSHHFAGQGYPRSIVNYWALGFALNILLNVALLERFGTVVASVASSITYTFILLLHLRFFRRHENAQSLSPRLTELAALLGTRSPLEDRSG